MLGLPNNNILHRRHVRVSWVDNAWCAQTLGKNKVVVVRADRGVSGSEKREIVPHAPYCTILGSKFARQVAVRYLVASFNSGLRPKTTAMAFSADPILR